jgi:uncharacterized repeat protein (TIGR01451 family)
MSSYSRLAAAGVSRMNANAGAGLGGHRLRTALVAAFAAIAVWAVLATPAHAGQTFAPLTGSTFQGGDGDQVHSSGTTDWQDYSSLNGTFDSPYPATTGPDSFYAGHEDTPDTWTLSSVDGGVSPSKSNALAVWSTRDANASLSDLFFYFSFLRQSTSNANAFYGVELNKSTNLWTNSVGTSVPCRSTGDLMISYEIDASNKNVNFKIYKWTGTSGVPDCPEGKTGVFTDVTPSAGADIQGYMNFDGQIANFLSPGAVGPTIDTGKFGEGAVNITGALGSTGSDSCVNFGQAQLHSRSSASLSSALQDTVNPEPIVLRSCTISGTKFHDLNANGVKDAGEPGLQGWTMYVDKNGNGQLDAGEPSAVTVADGSYTIDKVPAGNNWTVREQAPAGDTSTWYCSTPSAAGTLSTDCKKTGVVVANNANVTGVDFGNYKKAKLTVEKKTIPAGAGPFSFTSNDLSAADNSFQLSDGGTRVVTVDPRDAAYQVSETTDPNYDLSSIVCTGDSVAPDSTGSGSTATFNLKSGEDVKCTFTNTRKTGQITVKKTLVPSTDSGKFDLKVGSDVVASAVGDNGSGSETVPTGTYTVSELAAAGTGTSLGDYLSSVTCTKNGQAYLAAQDGTSRSNIVVNQNDAVVCTITNTRKGSVAIHKVGVGGTGTFDFTTSDAGVTGVTGLATGATSSPQTVAPGTYTFTEAAKAGWNLTGVSCDDGQSATQSTGDVNGRTATFKVDPGENVTCTFTNTHETTLTVIKQVVNDNGGTKVPGDFTMAVTGTGVSPSSFAGSATGTKVVLQPGAYSVDEGAHAGYFESLSADCSGTIAVGESRTCTITNDDVPGTLIVKKHVINDNGGTKTAADFTMTVTGPNATPGTFAGDEQGTSVSVDAGSYSVDEGAHAGYTETIGTDCSGTIAIGETKTCTITNDDIAPQLTVIKHVVNDNGGTKVAGDFTMNVTATSPSSASFPGDEQGKTITLKQGTYSVDEGDHTGYAKSLSADCTGSIAVGESKICTITNSDIAPKLIVKKHVINDNGGTKAAGDFTLSVNGDSALPSSFSGDELGTEVTLKQGSYSVDETQLPGYTKTLGTDCSGSIAVGETKTCTVTNNDQPATLIVKKHVINDNGGTKTAADFTMAVTGANAAPSSFGGSEAGTSVTLDAGSYSVDEGSHTGYAKTIADTCSGKIANGETKTCTITNDDIAPVLTVIKHVVNDNGGTKSASDFTMNVTATNPSHPSFPGSELGTTISLNQGNYSVDEGDHTGYDKSLSADCSGAIAVGESKTCTITNNDQPGTLIVKKHVINDNGGTKTAGDFTMGVTASNATPSSFAGDEQGTSVSLDAGSYTVDEGAHTGYTKTIGANCSGTIANGETKTCTITNDDIAPQLTVIKTVVNDNGGTKTAGDFTMNVTATSPSSASFPGDAQGKTITLKQGSYSVDEGDHTGYFESLSADCAGSIAVGESKTCTITNDDVAGTLIVKKHVINDNGGTKTAGNFQMAVDAVNPSSASFPGDEQGTSVSVDAGSYTVGEGAHAGYTETIGADCSGTIANGETKTCTITNNDIAPQLTVIKHVVNDNGGAKTADQFTMNVTATSPSNASFPGDEQGTTITLKQGDYSVDEGDHTGYDKSLSSDCAGTISVGETKTCTITNDDQAGTLIVKKTVINDNGGTKTAGDFQMAVTGTNATPSSFAGDAQGTSVTLDAGSYSVDEGAHTGYDKSLSADCAGKIANGETKTCTITNNDIAPQLTVIKHVDNGSAANGATAADFMMDVTATNPSDASFPGDEQGKTITLDAGSYNVDESGAQVPHYVKGLSEGCSGTIAIGESKTCTITNTRKATVRVDKVVPGGSDQKFGFTTTLTDGPSEFQLADADAPVVREVAPGQVYTVTEPDPGTGFKLTSSGCVLNNPQVAAPRLSTRAPTAEANKTVSVTPGVGDDITCTFVNTKLAGGLKVVKTGPAVAYNGDTLTFQYAVTNTGNTPINITSITDDKCSSITGPVKNNSNDDTWLDPQGTPDASKSEEWIYTCSMPAPVTKAGDPSLVNTVTVNGKDEKGNDVTAQDQHTTAFLHPAVGIAKTGPATALAGSLVQYTLTVTNPGDVAFADPLVVVTDTLCQAPPALSSKNGDSSPATFDPGETWTYTCSVQTQVGQTAVDNVADVKGTDQNGRSATAEAKFSTQLTQPQIAVAPETVVQVTPGTAKLRGPTGCPTRATTATVTGTRISKVTFYVDGKKFKTITRPDSKGRWSLAINPKKFAFGAHKVRVTVEFAANSGTKTKTLQLSFNRCRPAIVKPKFTG